MTTNLTPERIQELLDAETELNALHAYGVDSWEAYDIALEAVRKEHRIRDAIEDAFENTLCNLSETVDEPAGRDAGYGFGRGNPFEILHELIRKVDEIRGNNP